MVINIGLPAKNSFVVNVTGNVGKCASIEYFLEASDAMCQQTIAIFHTSVAILLF